MCQSPPDGTLLPSRVTEGLSSSQHVNAGPRREGGEGRRPGQVVVVFSVRLTTCDFAAFMFTSMVPLSVALA